jgi:hypothetical protein
VLNQQLEHQKEQSKHQEEKNALLQACLRKQERHLAAIRGALGISDHSSDDEERLNARAKHKVSFSASNAAVNAFSQVATAVGMSPPRDGEPPIALGRRVVECASATAASASAVFSLGQQLNDVHRALSIEPKAPPAERLRAIHKLESDVAKVASLKASAEGHFDRITQELGCEPSFESHLDSIKQLKKVASSKRERGDAAIGFHLKELVSDDSVKKRARVLLHPDKLSSDESKRHADAIREKLDL